MKDLMIILLLITTLYAAFSLNANQKQVDSQLKTISIKKQKLEFKESYIHILEEEAKEKDSLIIQLYKPIVRLQLACGIKEPDTTFTYIEKILNPCDIKKLIKQDLR